MKNIVFYPTVNEMVLNEIDYSSSMNNYKFYYSFDDPKINLKTNKELTKEIYSDGIYIKDDQYGYWSPKEYNLQIRVPVSMSNCFELFGQDGIASTDSKILVCLKWYCKTTNLKGIELEYDKHIRGEKTYNTLLIDKNTININQYLVVDIPKHSLRNDLTVSVCFISVFNPNKSEVIESEKHLIHNDGDVLGEIGNIKIIVEGNGSEFPIVTENNTSDEPLWYIYFDSDNPNEDPFDKDHIRLCFNEDHPDYYELELENFKNPTAIFREIFASCICEVIQNIKEVDEQQYQNTINNKNLEEGSISKAIYYFLNTLGVSTSSYSNMMRDVRKGIAKKL